MKACVFISLCVSYMSVKYAWEFMSMDVRMTVRQCVYMLVCVTIQCVFVSTCVMHVSVGMLVYACL